MLTTAAGLSPPLVRDLELLMRRAPRLTERATCELQHERDGMLRVVDTAVAPADQPGRLSDGMAIEFLLIGLREAGLTGKVDVPADDGHVVATIDVAGSSRRSKLDAALLAAAVEGHWERPLCGPHPGAPTTPYQRDVLTMTCSGPRAWLVCDLPVTPDARRAGVVTIDDAPPDWLDAGRVAASALLRATTLGLDAHLVTPSLHNAGIRELLRERPPASAYPQLLLELRQR